LGGEGTDSNRKLRRVGKKNCRGGEQTPFQPLNKIARGAKIQGGGLCLEKRGVAQKVGRPLFSENKCRERAREKQSGKRKNARSSLHLKEGGEGSGDVERERRSPAAKVQDYASARSKKQTTKKKKNASCRKKSHGVEVPGRTSHPVSRTVIGYATGRGIETLIRNRIKKGATGKGRENAISGETWGREGD